MERKLGPALRHLVKHLASLQSHDEVLPITAITVRQLLEKIVLRRYLKTEPRHLELQLCRHAVSWPMEPHLLGLR